MTIDYCIGMNEMMLVNLFRLVVKTNREGTENKRNTYFDPALASVLRKNYNRLYSLGTYREVI